jgi:hypothetical protein
MGGYGSGRHSNQPKIEDCNSLDANQLQRNGCLKNGWYGTNTWKCNGVKTSSIGIHASTNSLSLSYYSKRYGTVSQSVTIERIPCRFEGSRAYFRCDCGKRVVKLYSAGKHFRCRHCYRLPYSSKNESHWNRALRQRNKQRQRLSRNIGLEAYMAQKPKGMWWKTYHRLQERAYEAEQRSDGEFILMAQRLVKIEKIKS